MVPDGLYLYGLNLIGQQQGSAWTTLGYDPLGSVRFLLDGSGTLTHALNYDPYGVPYQSNTTTTLGFTGEQTDPVGLVNLRARTYNPRLGTFTSVDPVLGVGGSTGWNGYLYANANPANLTDPSGEFAFIPLLIAIGLGGLAGGTIYGWGTQVTNDPSWRTGSDRLSAIQHADWGKGLHDWVGIGAVGALVAGVAMAASPAAALVGGVTNVAAGLITGSYSGKHGLAAAVVDAYLGTIFGGIAGKFLSSVPFFRGTRVFSGTNWFPCATGYGLINASQGLTRKGLGNLLLGETYTTTTILLDTLADFTVGVVGTAGFDRLLVNRIHTSGVYLRSRYNEVLKTVASDFDAQLAGILLVSNLSRPVAGGMIQYVTDSMQSIPPRTSSLVFSDWYRLPRLSRNPQDSLISPFKLLDTAFLHKGSFFRKHSAQIYED